MYTFKKRCKLFAVALAFFLCLFPAPARADATGANALTPFAGEVKPWNRGAPETGAPETGTPVGLEFSPACQIRAGIAPHHGLASEMTARFYDNLPGNIERVILIGPDHFGAGRRFITLCPLPWRAGNGILETDDGAVSALSRTGAVGVESLPFRLEHSIGLHIVFIGRYFPDAKVTALMVNNAAPFRELSIIVPVLSELLSEKGTLLILSMDFSHDKMPEEATREDDKSVGSLLSFRAEAIRGLDIDAPAAAWLFLEVLKSRGIKDSFVLERTNSGEIIGRPDLPCTSYATMLFR